LIEDPPKGDLLSNQNLLKDKKDLPVAVGAKNSKSDYLVTGDKELLATTTIKPITTSNLLEQILTEQTSTTNQQPHRPKKRIT